MITSFLLQFRSAVAAAVIALPALAILPGHSFAMGSDSGGSDSGGSSGAQQQAECGPGERKSFWTGKCVARNATEECPRGEVISSQTGKCVKRSSSLFTDEVEDRYWHAVRLAHRENYEDAIIILNSVAFTGDVRVLTYLGFSHRKAGRIEEGLTYYNAALQINPDYTRAREYLGEAFIHLGRTDLANAELTEIRDRCGISCPEYRSLHGKLMDAQGI